MKLCKDCNYFRAPATQKDLAKCYHPSSQCVTDSVFGYTVFYSCDAIRNSTHTTACGAEGKFFDPIVATCAKPE